MKKTILSLLFVTALFCQEAQIVNIQAAQRTDGSQLVDIYYDLLPDQFFTVFNITLEVGLGNSFIDINEGLSGDIGQGVVPGNLKHIIFDVGNHSVFNNAFFENLIIRINGQSSIADELPFDNMITIESGNYNNCGTEENLDYTFNIMENSVTMAQFAEFLISKLIENEIIDTYFAFYSGDVYYPEGIYNLLYDGGAISWNGSTYIVDEGMGNEPVTYITPIGAKMFAAHHNLRLATLDELRKSISLADLNISELLDTGINYEYVDSINWLATSYINTQDGCSDTVIIDAWTQSGSFGPFWGGQSSAALYTFRCVGIINQ